MSRLCSRLTANGTNSNLHYLNAHISKKKVEKKKKVEDSSYPVPAKYIHTILCYLLSLNCAKTEALKEEQRNRDFLYLNVTRSHLTSTSSFTFSLFFFEGVLS